MKKSISNKISNFNFMLIVLIVLLHSSCLRFLTNPNVGIKNFYLFMKCLGDSAVPTFFALSAYLLFRNYCLEDIKIKFVKRIHSLLIPYFLWSVIFFCYYFLISKIPQIDSLFNSEFNFSPSNMFSNIIWAKCAEGMWFVRDLFIFVIFAPLIYLLIKKTKKIAIIFMGIFLGINIIYKFGYSNVIFWVPTYFMGAYLAINYKEKIENDTNTSILRTIFCWIILGIVVWFVKEYDEDSTIYYIFRMLSPILLYSCITWLKAIYTKPLDITKYSFLIFCMHLPILKIVRKIMFILFGYGQYVSICIYIMTALITISIVYVVGKLMKKFFPNFFFIATGNR